MTITKDISPSERLSPPPSPTTTPAPIARHWLLRIARNAVKLGRADREAGRAGGALRWLRLAGHLRVVAARARS